MLNEALSFGVLGATGRGLTEMHGVDVGDVEILTLSMAHSLAAVGGLCVGTTQVQMLLNFWCCPLCFFFFLLVSCCQIFVFIWRQGLVGGGDCFFEIF